MLAANGGLTEKEIQTMKGPKQLIIGGLTLAALAMAPAHPAKADPVTTTITATATAITLLLTSQNYGVIKWISFDPPPPPPPPKK